MTIFGFSITIMDYTARASFSKDSQGCLVSG